MSLELIHEIYQNIKTDNLCFIYQGEFTDDMLESIISLSEYNLNNKEDLRKLKRKVSFLMVESFQNIVKHGNKVYSIGGGDNKSGMFLIRNIGNVCYITSVNLTDNSNIEFLKSKLSDINNLDKDELRALSLETLSTGKLSEKGGAGLGFIEMARKTGQKLEFDFEKVNDKSSFFYLLLKLQGKNSLEEETEQKKFTINLAKDFHRRMISGNIQIVYKGDFSQISVTPILKIIKDSVVQQLKGINVTKRIYAVLVETLQNISKHAIETFGIQEGIIMIGKQKEQYIISTGNLISNEEIESAQAQLNKINGLDKNGLAELYKTTMNNAKVSDKGGVGLGLIKIARMSANELLFDFIPVEEDTSFFALNVRI
ncbi:SiaB family protein kinase [bacterium AH-315-M05]|nr:SiaB family protein kinase [bacterium AH-315-M05]